MRFSRLLPTALVAVALAGCSWSNLDPTDDSAFGLVVFHNDTRDGVELSTCGDREACHSLGFLPSGTTTTERVSWGDGTSLFRVSEPAATRWLLISLPCNGSADYWISQAKARCDVPVPRHDNCDSRTSHPH
jgi:hypothetical protein